MEKEKREYDPMKGTYPDAGSIKCKDCFYRDRTVIEVNGKNKAVGITKGFCAMFPAPPDSEGKPLGVLFNGDNCEKYLKDRW